MDIFAKQTNGNIIILMNNDDRFYKIVILLFGSWWSIIGHSLLFLFFILFSSDLLFFTTFLSIEAIFIGILILMATNQEQQIIDKRTSERRFRDRRLVHEDLEITHDVMEEIRLLKKHQMDAHKALEEIRDIMKTS